MMGPAGGGSAVSDAMLLIAPLSDPETFKHGLTEYEAARVAAEQGQNQAGQRIAAAMKAEQALEARKRAVVRICRAT